MYYSYCQDASAGRIWPKGSAKQKSFSDDGCRLYTTALVDFSEVSEGDVAIIYSFFSDIFEKDVGIY